MLFFCYSRCCCFLTPAAAAAAVGDISATISTPLQAAANSAVVVAVVPVYAFKEFDIPEEEMISIIQLCLLAVPPLHV